MHPRQVSSPHGASAGTRRGYHPPLPTEFAQVSERTPFTSEMLFGGWWDESELLEELLQTDGAGRSARGVLRLC